MADPRYGIANASACCCRPRTFPWSVCLLGTSVSAVKRDELIEMPFAEREGEAEGVDSSGQKEACITWRGTLALPGEFI